jgi:hypothetical protein
MRKYKKVVKRKAEHKPYVSLNLANVHEKRGGDHDACISVVSLSMKARSGREAQFDFLESTQKS